MSIQSLASLLTTPISKVIHADDDLTLALSVHYWTHATRTSDCDELWILLNQTFHLADLPSPLCEKILRDFKHGAGSYRRFLRKLETFLGWATPQSAQLALSSLKPILLTAIGTTPEHPYDDPDYVHTILKYGPLWKAIFLNVVKAPLVEKEGSYTLTLADPDVHLSALYLLVVCCRAVAQKIPTARPSFARNLIRAGVFDALDKTIPLCVVRRDERVLCMFYLLHCRS